jgi:competence protein ComEC
VSGENVTIVLGVTIGLARAAGIRRRGRAFVCAATLVAFVIVARPSPSVLRAAVMGGIALIAMVSGRRSSALPALSAAVALLLVLNPFLARTVGFVLSVVATAALVTIAPAWTARLERRMPRPLAIAIAVPAAAQLACTPILLLVFGQLTPYAVLANLLAAPAVVPATILGVATAVAAMAWPAGAELAAWLGAAPTMVIAEVARVLADLPGAAIGWHESVGGARSGPTVVTS